MQNFYTYIYLDTRKPGTYQYGDYRFDFEPFYVGKGKGNRCIDHLNESIDLKNDSWKNKHKILKIRKILNENLEPLILKVKENISEQESFELEIWLIRTIGRSDLKLGSLTNHTDGGDGSTGYTFTNEQKIKLSNSLKGRKSWNKGLKDCFTKEAIHKMSKAGKSRLPASEETKQKISNSKKGHIGYFLDKKHSEETKQKISNTQKGKKIPEDVKRKMSESGKVKIFTQEHKKNISNSIKGKKHPLYKKYHSKEAKEKMSESHKGKPGYWIGQKLSEETKRKISESMIKRKNDNREV